MKTDWVNDVASAKPPEFMKANQVDWIQRRNIHQDENGDWLSELRFISPDVYEQIRDQQDLIQETILGPEKAQLYKEGYEAALILLGGDTE